VVVIYATKHALVARLKLYQQDRCLPGESREGAIDIMFRQAMGMPGMMPMGNAGFFMGPQMGQGVPTGYMNKTVS
jgi:hypothetical protein